MWDGLDSGQPPARFAGHRQIHPGVMHRRPCAFTPPVLAQPSDPAVAVAEMRVAKVPLAPAAPRSPVASVAGMIEIEIEIELSGGRRVRAGPEVDADALRRLLAVPEPSA